MKVTARCSVKCKVKATGQLIAKLGRGRAGAAGDIGLEPAKAKIAAGKSKTLKLALSRGTVKVLRALAHQGASLTASIKLKATGGGDTAKARFTAKLSA